MSLYNSKSDPPPLEFACKVCGFPRPGNLVLYCVDCERLTPPRAIAPGDAQQNLDLKSDSV